MMFLKSYDDKVFDLFIVANTFNAIIKTYVMHNINS